VRVRRFAALAAALIGIALSAGAQSDWKAKLRELHARSAAVKVSLTDGATLRGRILRLDETAFTLQQEPPAADVVVPYAQVKAVDKTGLSRRAKAILIPAAIGGGVLLVLCAAPYPIGYLCRKDPS
jgi:hypothetical protein